MRIFAAYSARAMIPKRLALLLLLLALTACTSQDPYVTTVGVLAPGSTLTVRVGAASFSAYQPAAGQARDRFTVSATALAKSTPPPPPRLRALPGSGVAVSAPAPLAELLVRVPDGVNLRRELRPRRRARHRHLRQRQHRCAARRRSGVAARIRRRAYRERKRIGDDGFDGLAGHAALFDPAAATSNCGSTKTLRSAYVSTPIAARCSPISTCAARRREPPRPSTAASTAAGRTPSTSRRRLERSGYCACTRRRESSVSRALIRRTIASL